MGKDMWEGTTEYILILSNQLQQVEVLNEVAVGDTVWAELHYHGTQTDGKKFLVKGVTLTGIQADQISWARLYIEPVQEPH